MSVVEDVRKVIQDLVALDRESLSAEFSRRVSLSLRQFVLLMAFCCRMTAFAQTSAAPPVDVYTNFVGTWAGVKEFFKNGKAVRDPIQVVITETKKRDAIQCDDTYLDDITYRPSRLIRIDLAHNSMAIRNKNNGDETYTDEYQVSGLDRFAEHGYGSLVATGTSNNQLTDGKPTDIRTTFELRKESALERAKFSYRLEERVGGKPFLYRYVVLLSRLSSSTDSKPDHK